MLLSTPEKILIIDEDRSFADGLVIHLTTMGIKTKIVCDAVEGVALLRDGLYGIVILDPDKNISALEEISCSIPQAVILATAKFDSIGSSAQALKAGAVDLLPENMESGQLETIIRHALDRRFLLQQAVRLKKKITMLCILAGACFILGFLAFYLL